MTAAQSNGWILSAFASRIYGLPRAVKRGIYQTEKEKIMTNLLSTDQFTVLITIKNKRNGRMAIANAMRKSNSIAMTLVDLGLVSARYDALNGVTFYTIL